MSCWFPALGCFKHQIHKSKGRHEDENLNEIFFFSFFLFSAFFLFWGSPIVAYANMIEITIGSGPGEVAVDGGEISGGGGGLHSGLVAIAGGTIAADAATALGAAIGGGDNVIVVGNTVSIEGTLSGYFGFDAGLFSTLSVKPKKQPAPAAKPIKATNIFGPGGGTVTVGKDGSYTKQFNGPGINIIGSVDFNFDDLIDDVNDALYASLDAQSSSLPSGFYFSLETDGVSLNGNDLSEIEITDELVFDTPGVIAGLTLSVSLTTPVPEPGTMLLLGAGLLSLAGICRKKTA